MSNENNDQSLDIREAAVLARQLLRSYRMSGLQTLPKPTGQNDFRFFDATAPAPAAEPPTQPPPKPSVSPGAQTSAPSHELFTSSALDNYQSPVLDEADRSVQLQLINSEVTSCTNCSELSACRKNTVFGVGHVKPQVCFLGEGPGADEDRQGEPFVGAAGQLLNRILEACKMKREDVYILNTVKCRPPGNRNPTEDELANCWPYAIRQLEVLQPDFICCLGSVAARTLLETKQSIGRMRGQFFRFRGSQVIVTYHPAYLLRNPSAKRQVWDDMKMLLAAMGQPV